MSLKLQDGGHEPLLLDTDSIDRLCDAKYFYFIYLGHETKKHERQSNYYEISLTFTSALRSFIYFGNSPKIIHQIKEGIFFLAV